MNEIKVTVELCPNDRARLDKIIDLLEVRASQTQFAFEQDYDGGSDEINAMLKKVISPEPVEPPKNAQDEPKATDHPTLDPFPEQPEDKAEASEAKTEAPTVTTAELQQLVIALCRAGKKPEVVKVVNTYGVQTVSAIPEDKRDEAYAKLKALEG